RTCSNPSPPRSIEVSTSRCPPDVAVKSPLLLDRRLRTFGTSGRIIMSSDKPRVGFIGLGLMGHGMAKNLVSKGFPLTVRVHRNRKPAEDILAAGAREAKTNAELARASDIVILCVTGSPQIEEIVYGENGIRDAPRGGVIVVDTATADPAATARIRGDLAPA